MSGLPELVVFLAARADEAERGFGPATNVLELRRMLKSVEITQGTLDRYPSVFVQGVLDGMRQMLCIKSLPWSDHLDWDPDWRLVVEQGG